MARDKNKDKGQPKALKDLVYLPGVVREVYEEVQAFHAVQGLLYYYPIPISFSDMIVKKQASFGEMVFKALEQILPREIVNDPRFKPTFMANAATLEQDYYSFFANISGPAHRPYVIMLEGIEIGLSFICPTITEKLVLLEQLETQYFTPKNLSGKFGYRAALSRKDSQTLDSCHELGHFCENFYASGIAGKVVTFPQTPIDNIDREIFGEAAMCILYARHLLKKDPGQKTRQHIIETLRTFAAIRMIGALNEEIIHGNKQEDHVVSRPTFGIINHFCDALEYAGESEINTIIQADFFQVGGMAQDIIEHYSQTSGFVRDVSVIQDIVGERIEDEYAENIKMVIDQFNEKYLIDNDDEARSVWRRQMQETFQAMYCQPDALPVIAKFCLGRSYIFFIYENDQISDLDKRELESHYEGLTQFDFIKNKKRREQLCQAAERIYPPLGAMLRGMDDFIENDLTRVVKQHFQLTK